MGSVMCIGVEMIEGAGKVNARMRFCRHVAEI
jgi:hypothetical protein